MRTRIPTCRKKPSHIKRAPRKAVKKVLWIRLELTFDILGGGGCKWREGTFFFFFKRWQDEEITYQWKRSATGQDVCTFFFFFFLLNAKLLFFFLSGLQKCSFATSKWGPRRKPSQRRSQRKMRRLEQHWKKLRWQKSQVVKRMQKNPPLQPNQGLWRPQRCRRLEPQLRAKQPASLPLLPKLAEQRKVHSKCINFKCLILVVQ